jgi:hypothetical protein
MRPRSRALRGAASAALLAGLLLPQPAAVAMPYFAYRYGYACTQCHTTVPQLTPFGKAFKYAGYRIPGPVAQHSVTPLSMQNAILHTSDADPSGLPKTVVDYLTVNSAGPIGRAFDYFADSYVVDGGRPGALHDAWIEFSSGIANPDAPQDLRLKAGQFYLPLPVSPEIFRETIAHYAVFDQTVGRNPFDLGESRLGVDASLGAQYAGSSLHVVVTQGHDFQSGLPSSHPDLMLFGAEALDGLTLSAYAVEGARDLNGPVLDRFAREGAAAGMHFGKGELVTLLQTGSDSSSDGAGKGERSNAAFAQLRWLFSPALTGIVRQDLTGSAAGNVRSTTAAVSLRTRANSRLVVQEVFGQTRSLDLELFVAN